MTRRLLKPQDWLEENPLAKLDGYDPLKTTLERVRAQRQGRHFVPAAPNSILNPEVTPGLTTPSPIFPDLRFLISNANKELSGAGFKILMAILSKGNGSASLSELSRATGLHKETVIKGTRECLDYGWLERFAYCTRCQGELRVSEGQKVALCPNCDRQVPPEYQYAIVVPVAPPDTAAPGDIPLLLKTGRRTRLKAV